MKDDISKHIKPMRLASLPEEIRQALKESRLKRGLSQAELGHLVGLPQMHISGIETGKIIPRFNTLLELVRTLDYDLMLVPKALVPAVNAMINGDASDEEQPLYAVDINHEK